MSSLLAYYQLLASTDAANRALVLENGDFASQGLAGSAQLGSSWEFAARLRRKTLDRTYAITFSSAYANDALGIYGGYGPGGYTFFARDQTAQTNLALALTDASQSPAGQWQVLQLGYASGVLTATVDGVVALTQNLGAFYFDAPVGLNLCYRNGNQVGEYTFDWCYLASGGVRLFDYQFNEVDGLNAQNAGTVGGELRGAGGKPLLRIDL